MKKKIRRTIMIGWLAFCIVQQADAQDNSIVQYTVQQPESHIPGDSSSIKIVLDIQSGWYIYAPSEINETQDVQIMKLKISKWPDAFGKKGSMKLPPSKMHGSYEVFEGRGNSFQQNFVIPPSVNPGVYEIVAELNYQACSDRICYPPVTEKIIIPVTVK